MKGTKDLKENQGITLIALVITIIVMLILVAVTITMAVNGGLFEYAGRAATQTNEAIDAEQTLASGRLNIKGKWYNSIDEYLNEDSSSDQSVVIEVPETYAYSFDVGENIVAYLVENTEASTEVGETVYDMLIIGTGEMYSVEMWGTDLIECTWDELAYAWMVEWNVEVKNAMISKGVTSIGNYAFKSCTGLTSVTIPHGLTSIGFQGFKGCTGLTSVTIPQGVTEIGSEAFQYCTSLSSITIPEGVTKVKIGTFQNCTSLRVVTIPRSVRSIESSAFAFCTSLTNITILDGVESIGYYAFDDCDSLTTVNYGGTTEQWGSIAIQKTGNEDLTNANINCVEIN